MKNFSDSKKIFAIHEFPRFFFLNLKDFLDYKYFQRLIQNQSLYLKRLNHKKWPTPNQDFEDFNFE